MTGEQGAARLHFVLLVLKSLQCFEEAKVCVHKIEKSALLNGKGCSQEKEHRHSLFVTIL